MTVKVRNAELIISGPAGHFWALSERYSGALLCLPMSAEREQEEPAHPDALSSEELEQAGWYEASSEAGEPELHEAMRSALTYG